MNVKSNFVDGVHKYSIHDLTIDEIDDLRKALYYAGWYNEESSYEIIKSFHCTYWSLCNAIEKRERYVNGKRVESQYDPY